MVANGKSDQASNALQLKSIAALVQLTQRGGLVLRRFG
jgi:hypothetical protein